MKNFIQNLQNKSDSFKHIVMWSGVFLIMSVIFTFWLVTFPSQIPPAENDEATKKIQKELPGIWQELKDQFNNFKGLENLWQR